MEMFWLPAYALLKDLMQRGVGDERRRWAKRSTIKCKRQATSQVNEANIEHCRDCECHDDNDQDQPYSLLSDPGALDNSGPALYDSYSLIISLHKVFCLLPLQQWPKRLACELVLSTCAIYGLFYKVVVPFYHLPLVSRASSNPTFVVVQSLAIGSSTCQMMATRWFGMRNSDTCYKILKQTRLCFLDARITRTIGNYTFTGYLLFLMYNALLCYMLAAANLNQFVEKFSWLDFMCVMLAASQLSDLLVGVARMDFFIRSSLALWVIGLRDHLKRMFIARRAGPGACQALDARTLINAKVWTFERIQSSLNHMDDQLEEMRGIQEVVIVFLTINSFAIGGSCVLLAFESFAMQNDYYHGTICLLLLVNVSIAVLISYLGDGYLYHALSSLIYCIECEYYTNMDIHGLSGPDGRAKTPPQAIFNKNKPSDAQLQDHGDIVDVVVHNKDILFYQEFLKQFENHLATPWSQMTFNSHLRIVKGFVTLVASQIMFEHQS